MGGQSLPKPITVEEYERIPDPPGGRYELHHGELVDRRCERGLLRRLYSVKE